MKKEAEIKISASADEGFLFEKYEYSVGAVEPLPSHTHVEYQFSISPNAVGEYLCRGGKYVFAPWTLSIIHSGERHAPSDKLAIEQNEFYFVSYLTPDEIMKAAQEIGTGVYTVLAQMASEALEISTENIRVRIGDTLLPEANMTAGSSSTMGVGSAVYDASLKLKKKIEEFSGEKYNAEKLGEILKNKPLEKISADGEWTPGNKNIFGEPDDVSMHTFGAVFAEVRVDRELLIPRVSKIVGVYSVGRIVNPKMAKSQMTGGMIWGIGQALTEHSILDRKNGCFLNRDLAGYEIPANLDVPHLEAHFVEEIDERASTFGGKGIGELGAVGVSAAIANAIFNATGKRVRELPITLDKLI